MKNVLIAGMLLLSILGVATPAGAHTCASYNDCEATGCNEGENHSHTDYNYFERDESCSSTKNGDPPPPAPPPCIIADKEFPREVCDLLKAEHPRGMTIDQ